MHTVAVIDTEPLILEGLRSLLEAAEGLRLVLTENSLALGMEAARDLEPSVLVIDSALGAHAVQQFLTALRASRSHTAAVVWSASLSDSDALRFVHCGASGVIRKSASLNAVLNCLETVAGGGTWIEEEILREPERPVRSARSPLTARELQVMELVERGLKNREIAESLGIRTGTVKIHLKHIFEKTGIRGRYGLALSGLKEKGLLALPAGEPV